METVRCTVSLLYALNEKPSLLSEGEGGNTSHVLFCI